MPLDRIVATDLSGGLNQASPELIATNECQHTENCDFSSILGAFVSRKGSTRLNTASITDGITLNVTSNFKLYNAAGQNYRYTTVGNTQFRNFVSFKTQIAARRVSACGFRNQAFFSDSATYWVDDGTSVAGYPWGIAAPSLAVTLQTGTQPSVQLAHFDNTGTGSENWISLQGTQSFNTNTKQEGAESLQIIADATTFRGMSTLAYGTAQNFGTVGGVDAGAQGVFQLWVWVSSVQALSSLTIQIDLNDGSFGQDFLTYTLAPSSPTTQNNDVTDISLNRADLSFQAIRAVQARARPNVQVRQNFLGLAQNGWTHLLIPMSRFTRTGATFGKDLTTTKALSVQYQATSAITVLFDDWKLTGNKQASLNDQYFYYETFQHRDTSGNLLNESNPSPISTAFQQVTGAALVVSVNTTTNSMVTHKGFYRIGGFLDQAYFLGSLTYAPVTTFTDTVADLDLMLANIPLATDNNAPPANYYFVEGPYFDRIFMGSGNNLIWSKVNFPHSFPSTNTSPLPGAQSGDGIQNIKRFGGRLFVFTSSKVYELLGNSEANFEIRTTLSRTGLSASWTVVDAGDSMIYLGGQGSNAWGLYQHNGLIDQRISYEKLQPFFTGRTPSGGQPGDVTEPLNLNAISACSAVWYKDSYWLAYPSGTNTAANKILRLDFSRRHAWGQLPNVPVAIYSYSAPAFINVLDVETVEGLLVAGDSAGFLYQLETGNTDNGAAISWIWRSKAFPLGQSHDRQPLWQARAEMNSAGNKVTFEGLYDDGSFFVNLGDPITSKLSWSSDVRGETTEVPLDNVSVKLTSTTSLEQQVFQLLVDNVRYK